MLSYISTSSSTSRATPASWEMPTPAPKPFAPPRAKLGLDHRFAEVPAERPKQDQLREKSMVLDQLAREILALDEMTLEEEERRRSHQSSAAGDTLGSPAAVIGPCSEGWSE